jgi:hypothetical protein
MQFEELLKRIAILLDSHKILYMLLGGQAVLRYGKPRLTEDVDVTLGLGPTESAEFLDILSRSDFTFLVDDPEGFLKQTFVLPVRDNLTAIRVDFIFSLSDYERRAIERAIPFDLDGVPVNYISIEDLIIHKLVASRPRDLEDVLYVILKNPSYDKSYVLHWLEEYDRELPTNLVHTLEDIVAKSRRSG